MMRLMLIGLGFALAAPALAVAAGRPMTIDDLLAVRSVSDPQISPDGKAVAYVVSEIDPATGKSNSDIWIVPASGGEPRRMTTTPGADNHPRWSPDGRTIAFVSGRGGSSQVWLLPVDGGEARQLTRQPIDVSGPIWSPKGDRIAFTARVYPDSTPLVTSDRDRTKAAEGTDVKIYDDLMMRHWDTWEDGKKSHLFVADVATGDATDLTPALKANVPPAPFGGSSDYAFSPDGAELAFTAEPLVEMAWSTNTDIWTVPVGGGELKNVTESNKGADAQPSYSADGKWISWLSQARAGFEADQWVLNVRPRGEGGGDTLPLTAGWDRPVLSYVWAGPSRLVAVIDDQGTEPIAEAKFTTPAGTPAVIDGNPTIIPKLVTGAVNTAVQVGPDGTLVYLHHDATRPAEVYTAKADGTDPRALTRHNAELVAQLDLPKAESFTFKGAEGDTVQGWLIRPPGMKDGQKVPVAFLIHGGPQGAWHDEWHSRWNYGLFAAPGYAVVAINPRGSTGFGQTFTDQISGDWAGRVFDDLMAGLDHAIETYDFLDADRVAALGGSYGGYMVNWIAGHTKRFKALVSHAGVYDLPSMYSTTEELWFPEWEFGGPPWDKPELYEKLSPSRSADRFRTPTLVIHGALDFRVPEAQGMAFFTDLQRRGIPSRLVYFPDEGHWINKAANRRVWWREIHAWLAKYLQEAPPK